MDKRKVARELAGMAKEIISRDKIDSFKLAAKSVKVKSAVQSNVPGIVVGLTPNKKVLIFRKNDYDSKGKVTGPVEDVTQVAEEDGFYLLSFSYDDEELAELGHHRREVRELETRAKRFLRKTAKEITAVDSSELKAHTRQLRKIIDRLDHMAAYDRSLYQDMSQKQLDHVIKATALCEKAEAELKAASRL